MRLRLLSRYRHHGTTTWFTPLPYLQVRFHENRIHSRWGEGAICLAWLFWSIRWSWEYRLY